MVFISGIIAMSRN